MLNLIEKFKQKIVSYSEDDQRRIIDAAIWAKNLHNDQKRASGEPYFIHPLHVAETLVYLKLDADAVIAGFLHDIMEDTDTSFEDILNRFGFEVAKLVDGVTKISIVKVKNKSLQEAQTIRKMLFAMSEDIRVIIIKLADKLHNMNTLEFLSPQRRKIIATECLDIYAPLADRLGISWMKDELEDLALKALNPEAYAYIKNFLLSRRSERNDYLKRIEKAISRASGEENITDILVSSRTKHFYSIYLKMKRRKKKIDEIYDIHGVRILCNTTNECYTLLGVIHKLWPPIEGRFKDYIAMPKANQYQSLHTTVMSYNGKLLEIQIRTKAMHYTAEYGVAAHWTYKHTSGSGIKIPRNQLPIINKLKHWDQQQTISDSFLDEIKEDLLKDSIYVFTPKGHIVELPKNSTAIDFAYHIHTEVGHHMIGAKADGSIISLGQPLKNTQTIEILTATNARPHINWLRLARTTRARQKIRYWLNKHDETLLLDKNIIAKGKPEQKHAVQKAVRYLQKQAKPKEEEIVTQVIDQAKVAFKIGDETNMMISIAQCCKPTRGDDIVGYISRGRGIIVHQRNCKNLLHIKDIENRSIEVEWETVSPKTTKRFQVTSRIVSDLFSEIESAVRKFHGHLIEGKLEETEKDRLIGSFTMEIDQKNDYKKVLKCIRNIPSVLNLIPL